MWWDSVWFLRNSLSKSFQLFLLVFVGLSGNDVELVVFHYLWNCWWILTKSYFLQVHRNQILSLLEWDHWISLVEETLFGFGHHPWFFTTRFFLLDWVQYENFVERMNSFGCRLIGKNEKMNFPLWILHLFRIILDHLDHLPIRLRNPYFINHLNRHKFLSMVIFLKSFRHQYVWVLSFCSKMNEFGGQIVFWDFLASYWIGCFLDDLELPTRLRNHW